MDEKLIAAVTPAQTAYQPYLNATDLGDGTVRVILRANPQAKTGCRVCSDGPRDPNYRVGISCFAGGEGCNNYCNMHPNRRTKENPDGLPMANRPEPVSYTKCGETLSCTLSRADWDDFLRQAKG